MKDTTVQGEMNPPCDPMTWDYRPAVGLRKLPIAPLSLELSPIDPVSRLTPNWCVRPRTPVGVQSTSDLGHLVAYD